MKKGAEVKLSTGNGVITTVVSCRINNDGPGYLGEPMVLKVYVKPEGVAHSWPMNPFEPVTLRRAG